jgi:hypothetical protein
MPRHDATAVADLVAAFLQTRNPAPLQRYLQAHSALPGPRSSLELAHAFADAAGGDASRVWGRLWHLSVRWTRIPAADAPENTPGVFLPVCGALAIGAIAAAHGDRMPAALVHLYSCAHDTRWRVREGAVMGLQRLLGSQPRETIVRLARWIAANDWLAMRAAVAAVAEPPLLAVPSIASAALRLHETVVTHVLAARVREGEPFRVLRQTLGYSISVVMVVNPKGGFALLRRLAASGSPDGWWIVKENLKKRRLAAFPREIAALERLLIARTGRPDAGSAR